MSAPTGRETRGGVPAGDRPTQKWGGRLLLAVVVASPLGGCAVKLAPGDCSITADLACETACALLRSPAPPDKPSDGDKCQNCGGTGKVGDGRVAVKCAACDGTGKAKKTQPVAAKQPCANGVCPR